MKTPHVYVGNAGNLDILINDQTVAIRVRHVVQGIVEGGVAGCLLGPREVDSLVELLLNAKARVTSAKKAPPVVLETSCSVCGAMQLDSPSGAYCANGHGGAPGEDPRVHYWVHPESGSVFTTEPGEEFPGDPLCEEVDADQFRALQEHYGKPGIDDPFACLSEEPDAFNIL